MIGNYFCELETNDPNETTANVEYFYKKCNQLLNTAYTEDDWGGIDNIKKAINIEWLVLATQKVYQKIHQPKKATPDGREYDCILKLSPKFTNNDTKKIAVTIKLVDHVITYLINFKKSCDNDCACYRDMNCHCSNGNCNCACSTCGNCSNCNCGSACGTKNCDCECGNNTECVCDCNGTVINGVQTPNLGYECNCTPILNCPVGTNRGYSHCSACDCDCDCECACHSDSTCDSKCSSGGGSQCACDCNCPDNTCGHPTDKPTGY